MIYLLQDCYKDDVGCYHDILKIGYSKLAFSLSREKQYYTHNYGYKLLKEREGDVELEGYLHKVFSKYLLPESTEWFSYDQEIVDKFDMVELPPRRLGSFIPVEEYISLIRSYILADLLPTPEELFAKYKDELLAELHKLHSEKFSYLPWEEETYLYYFSEALDFIDNTRRDFWRFYNFLGDSDIKDLVENDNTVNVLDNPWKTRAELYYKTLGKENEVSEEAFRRRVEMKLKKTENLLRSFKTAPNEAKHDLAETFQYVAKSANYKDNYVAVNEHAGSDLVPCLNNLVLVAEERAFDIQQKDYKDRFTVFNTLCDTGNISNSVSENITNFLRTFETLPIFHDKMRYLCECSLSEEERGIVLDQIPIRYKNYYIVLGPEKCRANSYSVTEIEKVYSDMLFDKDKLRDAIYSTFSVGSKYAMSDIKETLGNLYKSLGYNKSPMAVDLEEYFEIKKDKVTVDGKRLHAFKLLKRKDNEG